MAHARGTPTERKAQAVDAGLEAFADHGLTTAAIQRIAHRIGVSQPYVFRLFGTKQALFLACLDGLETRVAAVFSRPGPTADPTTPLADMAVGFRELISDGVIGGFWLQACAAARADETIAARCRDIIAHVLNTAGDNTSADADELARFFAGGALTMMLHSLNVDLTPGAYAAVASLIDKDTEP